MSNKSGNRKSRSNEGFILFQNNVGKTVQTSWRPQLPLPKEVVPPTTAADPNTRLTEMNRHSSTTNHSKKDTSYQNAPQPSGNKKWSFGRLFRKKKEVETESSSEEDRKAGFVPSPKYRKKDKKKRGSKLIGSGFDHIVVTPTRDNEFFLPFEPVPPVEGNPGKNLPQAVDYTPHSRSTNSLDRRGKRDRKSLNKDAQGRQSSSEEELVSMNSSTTFTKYRSDESLGSGALGLNGNNGQSRRSRAARNERYYKRLSRDGEVSHGQVPVMYAPQPAQRWKTQPVSMSIYTDQSNPMTSLNPEPKPHQQYPPSVPQDGRYRNSTSLSYMAPLTYGMLHPPKNLQNTVNDSKRSISYDSHIHVQNVKKPLPPPPPPRDPMRRISVTGHNNPRPISYAFDQTSSQAPKNMSMSGRCVSDDRIWSGNAPLYQSGSSLNNPPSNAGGPQHRRFITRAERDAHPGKKSLPSGLDYRYVAEATPRSRKPIHLLNQQANEPCKPPSPVRTTKSGLPEPPPPPMDQPKSHLSSEFWRRGRDPNPRQESSFIKPRSVSSSRVGELRRYNVPMYSEVSKPKQKPAKTDEVNQVISGSLLIKPTKDNQNNYVEIRHNAANKSNSMPNHYQRRDITAPRLPKSDSPIPPPNKYDEYVAEKRIWNILDHPQKVAPDPPQRKAITKPTPAHPEPEVAVPRKKPTNLDDAINELEAIYKSLKLGDESLLDRAERRDIPTPTNFEKYAELHSEEFMDDDDDDGPTKEPDLVRDDFAYRSIKHANLVPKSTERQPPFGIPVGPIPPSPRTDYLHVTPDKDSQKVRTAPFKYPDIIGDDLAVRTLRKDPPGQKQQFLFPSTSLRKKRATRTQSANIYNLIQRNAAKPSGGDMHDYLELAKTLERAGSMSDIRKETDDIPSTLQLLRNLREQEQNSMKPVPFRHPSQGGAICSLPEVLSKEEGPTAIKPPIPMPRKSITPDTEKMKMEDALNKIAKEAKESSDKLTRDLMELRKEALITSSRPPNPKASIERDLEQIEAVSEAAKRCRHILMDTLPPDPDDITGKKTPPRRLVSEDKLIKAIDQVSDAANKVCEKILNEIVTVQPPVVVHTAVEVKNRPKQELVTPGLIQKLDPSSASIGEIAERCMRQISELNDLPDYDNLQPPQHQVQVTACNTTKTDTDRVKRSDADLLIVPGSGQTAASVHAEEEIDKIMKECEQQARFEATTKVPSKSDDATRGAFVGVGDKTVNTTSTSSSSDCLKSSSPSAGPHLSSSITSFNPYSSSDYIKSPSSDFHAPSTDPIKTFSTTSYDVQSSSVTPNITNSPFSCTPSPPLNLTPVGSSGGEKGERSDSASQYNSSEELAMIFGIEKSSPATTTTTAGKRDEDEIVNDCTVPSPAGVYRCSEPNKPDVETISVTTTTIRTATTTTITATNPEFCESVLVCKLGTIDEDHENHDDPKPCHQVSRLYFPSYASNINIVVTSVPGGDGDQGRAGTDRQLDSLSSIDECSNPDSGNVSLSDFPVPSPVNASLEVELPHNSRFEVAEKFVNEVTINRDFSEVDYLRSMYAQDEVSTSFSFDDGEGYSDHDEIEVKDPHSPGQLLHEVLSQVSRINAGTNSRQLISQLENISECTKIIEDLSDRLSHQSARTRNSGSRPKGEHRVRFSDDSAGDHEEDQQEYSRSLDLLGHNLSSSEESIPAVGEIFTVPISDSDDEVCDCGEKISKYPAPVLDSVDLGDAHQPLEQVPEIEVVESGSQDGSEIKTFSSENLEDESLTLSSEVISVIEIIDSSPKRDPQLDALLSRSKLKSSEVVSIVEIVDSPCSTSSTQFSELTEEVDCDLWCPTQTPDISPHNEDQSSYEEDKSTIRYELSRKAVLSPMNISLKIVNQVSKVRYVQCEDDELLESISEEVSDDSVRWEGNEGNDLSEVFVDQVVQDDTIKVDSEIPSVDDVNVAENCSDSGNQIVVDQLEVLEGSIELEKPKSRHHPSSSEGSIQLSYTQSDQEQDQTVQDLLRCRPASSPADISPSQVPSTPTGSKTLSLLAQPRHDDRMTTLEHILLACTLGIVTGNDFITMLAIIIGVLTVIAIVLL